MLIQAQVNEEQRCHQLNEFHNLEADLEALSHKYDRKELCLQNLERKTNYYEMYIVKKASSYGQNDKEANLLLKKFQHEKFSGGIENICGVNARLVEKCWYFFFGKRRISL